MTALTFAVEKDSAANISAIIISKIANLSAEPEQAKNNQTLLINQLTNRIQNSLNRRAVMLLAIMLEDDQALQGLRNSIIQNFDHRNPNQPLSQEANSLFSNLRELRQRLIAVPLNPEIANATLVHLLQGDNLSNISNYYFPHNRNQNDVLTRLDPVEPTIRSFVHYNPRLSEELNAQTSQVIATFFRERQQAAIGQLPANQVINIANDIPLVNNQLNNNLQDNFQAPQVQAPQVLHINNNVNNDVNVDANNLAANDNFQANIVLITNDNQPSSNIVPNDAHVVLERFSCCAIS
jgi:hypothetical protein